MDLGHLREFDVEISIAGFKALKRAADRKYPGVADNEQDVASLMLVWACANSYSFPTRSLSRNSGAVKPLRVAIPERTAQRIDAWGEAVALPVPTLVYQIIEEMLIKQPNLFKSFRANRRMYRGTSLELPSNWGLEFEDSKTIASQVIAELTRQDTGPIEMLIELGAATPKELAAVFAELSVLYRMCGGSGLRFDCLDSRHVQRAFA